MTRRVLFYETRKLSYLINICDRYHELGYETHILNEKALETSKEWKEFQSNYQHSSTNNEEFELACFARYFALNEYFKSNEIDTRDFIILSDSDVVPQFHRSEKLLEMQLENTFVASQNFNTLDELEPQYSPHFSAWNSDLVRSFIEYIIDFYKHQYFWMVGNIKMRYERLGMNTSVSDMTLLYQWVRETKLSFYNLSDFSLKQYSDHNVTSAYRVIGENSDLSIPIYNPIKQKIGFFCLNGLKCYWPIVLHVQGGKKRLIPLFYRNKFLFYIILLCWMFAEKTKMTKFVKLRK